MLLDVAIRGSIVLLIGLSLCLALRTRAAALRHALLAAAFCVAPVIAPAGLLLPPVRVGVPTVARAVGAPEMASATPSSPTVSTATGAAMAVTGLAEVPPATGGPASAIRWATLALGIWVVGTAMLLGHLVLSVAQLALATRRARPLVDERWQMALADATRAAGVRRTVSLRESPRADVLATWGWRKPCLFVPAGALDWPADRTAIVLGHELAHIRRMDWVWQMYAATIRAVFWWNPLAWLAHHQLTVESERACDDAVLALGVTPQTYAEQLVAVARALHVKSSLSAIAVSMARPSTLHRRITAMLNPRLQRTIPGRVANALLAGGLLALLVPVAVVRGTAAQGPLEGVVYDATGAVVPDVRLVLNGNGREAEATTDAEGRFVFAGVDPGRYALQGAIPGFRELRQNIELEQASDWTRVVTLQVGDVQETISVKAQRGAGPVAAPAGPVRIRVGGNIRPPRRTHHVMPVYPESARNAGYEGVVSIEAVIGRDGAVTAGRVTSPEVYPELAAAALDAVRQWRFTPTLLNGGPTDVVMTVSVTFALE